MTEYYVRNLDGGFLGNGFNWVAKDRHGYSYYIQNAHRYSEEEANAEVAGDPTKYQKYECELIDRRLHLVFDGQDSKRLHEDPATTPNPWGEGYKYAEVKPSNGLTDTSLAEIKQLVADYIEQDNRETAWPIQYQVQSIREYPAAENYGAEKQIWFIDDDNYHEFESSHELLEFITRNMDDVEQEKFEEDFEPDNYYMELHRVYETVHTCFTQKQANNYQLISGKYLVEPRTYVTHCGRQSEAEFILRTMFQIAGEDYDKHAK